MTAKAAVIGWPVDHSLSPVLHGYWLKKYAIDGSYERIAIPPQQDFGVTVLGLRDAGYRGVNVTVPYKEAAFRLADVKGQNAALTGAANLLLFGKDGRILADNTDGTGLAASLEEKLGPLGGRDGHVVILGAGGAARGALAGLSQRGVARIIILNRHGPRADQLVEQARRQRLPGNVVAGSLEDWPGAARAAWLVINTTSAGMKGNPALAIDVGLLPPSAAVCDIVYNPLETPLLAAAKTRGLETIDGLGMLMHQAAPSFQAFFHAGMGGRRPDVTPELRAVLQEELAQHG